MNGGMVPLYLKMPRRRSAYQIRVAIALRLGRLVARLDAAMDRTLDRLIAEGGRTVAVPKR